MVLISNEHFTKADTTVPIGRATFVVKGTQLYFSVKKKMANIHFIQNVAMTGSFVLKVSVILNVGSEDCGFMTETSLD